MEIDISFNGQELDIMEGFIEENPFLPCDDNLYDKWFQDGDDLFANLGYVKAPSDHELRKAMVNARNRLNLNEIDYE